MKTLLGDAWNQVGGSCRTCDKFEDTVDSIAEHDPAFRLPSMSRTEICPDLSA